MALQSLVCFSSSGPAKDWPSQARPHPHGLRRIRRHRAASLVLDNQGVGGREPALLPPVDLEPLRVGDDEAREHGGQLPEVPEQQKANLLVHAQTGYVSPQSTVAPEDVETMPAASFRVYQDNALKCKHNDELTRSRWRRLEEALAFRKWGQKKSSPPTFRN